MITTVIIVLYGFATVLMLSAMASNADGTDVSIIQTVQAIWDDNLSMSQSNPLNTFSATAPAGYTPLASTVANNATGPTGGTVYL